MCIHEQLSEAARDNRLWRWIVQVVWRGKHAHGWTRLLYDEDADEPNWRSVLEDSWRDSTRTAISEQELVQKQWMVSFCSRWEGRVLRQGYFLSTGIYHNNKGHTQRARTHAHTHTHTCFNSVHQLSRIRFAPCLRPEDLCAGAWSTGLPYKLGQGGERVMIGAFEDLVVSRDPLTWGWK